jgi:hypothetical protein
MNNKLEISINIILIVIGLIGGTLFYLNANLDLSLIFFSISLASILYQFLGGINEKNEFNLGAIKFGSSAAVLIGFMFFFKKIIFTSSTEDLKNEFSEQHWIPVDKKTGDIISVDIKAGNETITIPKDSLDKLPSFKLNVTEDNGVFQVGINKSVYNNDGNDVTRRVGDFTIKELNSKSLYNHIDLGQQELQIFTLYKDRSTGNSTKDISLEPTLPFEITVSQRGNFSLINTNDKSLIYLSNRPVNSRSSYFIKLSSTEQYLVMILQAHHLTDEQNQNYSKWLVKKVEPTLVYDKK